MAKTTSYKRVTGAKPTASGGSRVYANVATKTERGSRSSRMGGYAVEFTDAFVDTATQTHDPARDQARVCDLGPRDFGKNHTAYNATNGEPMQTLRKRQKGSSSSSRNRTADAMMRLQTGDKSFDENCLRAGVGTARKWRDQPKATRKRGSYFRPRLVKNPTAR